MGQDALKAMNTKEGLANRAYSLFEEFSSAYAQEWARLEEAERMYFGDHWHLVPELDPNEPRPVTPVLQSTVENIAADLIDLMPEASILARTPEDENAARLTEALIRENHASNCYEREYRQLCHDLLVGGYMVQEVGYDPSLFGGFGGAFIRHADNMGILFDPLCSDIQEGRAVIKFGLRTIEWLKARFPMFEGESDGYSAKRLPHDVLLGANRHKCALLLEFWWREYDEDTGASRLHMAQLTGGKVVADSRRAKPEGYFSHGKYPFIVTALYPRKGSCLGYGLVDMFKRQQQYADKLDQIVLKNALMASHNKLLVTHASGFDTDDLRDWSKEVHTGESLNGITWFTTPPLPAYIMQYIQLMRETIKDESGANDFSRGGIAGGITAASAIAALQEMSSKRSRMISAQMHEAYREAVRLEIEVERELNILPRTVYFTVDGERTSGLFDSGTLKRRLPGGKMQPIDFSVLIKVQKQNRWSVLGQNELVLQMLSLGVLTSEQAVELMHFEGKELVLKRAKQNAANSKHLEPASFGENRNFQQQNLKSLK